MNFENRPSGKNAIFRDQIVTNEDLLTFKSDLITEIKSIAKDLQDNGGKKWLRFQRRQKDAGHITWHICKT
jgi:hypothetical protein